MGFGRATGLSEHEAVGHQEKAILFLGQTLLEEHERPSLVAAAEAAGLIHYWLVYPNLMLGVHPDYLLVHRVWPLDVDRSRVDCEILEIGTDFSESEYTPEVQKTRFQYSSVLFGIKFRGICEESKRLRVALNSALTGLALEGTAIRSAEITSYADTSWRIEADRILKHLKQTD